MYIFQKGFPIPQLLRKTNYSDITGFSGYIGCWTYR